MLRSVSCPRACLQRLQLASTRHRITRQSQVRAASTFDYRDSLQSNRLLDEDEIEIASVAKEYSQEKLLPRVLNAYRNESFDKGILKEMGSLGFLGATIKGYGCAGISDVAMGLITREVERVDSGYRSALSVQSSLAMGAIYDFGTQELKERFLPDMAAGNVLGCFGLTEPNHGSDPGSMETTARPDPNREGVFLLSGSKTWITNSPISDVLVVWAKLDGKIRGFLVERSRCPEGTLETPAIKNKTGLRASITGMIHMENAPVFKENMFPDVVGLKGPFACLNNARYGIAWGTMGALEDCIERARDYALSRKQFKGNPLAKYQLVQKKLADAVTDVTYGLLA
ncbi:hypothetical protein TWF696_007112 [Orbilia brochopaga]